MSPFFLWSQQLIFAEKVKTCVIRGEFFRPASAPPNYFLWVFHKSSLGMFWKPREILLIAF